MTPNYHFRISDCRPIWILLYYNHYSNDNHNFKSNYDDKLIVCPIKIITITMVTITISNHDNNYNYNYCRDFDYDHNYQLEILF